MSIVLDATIIKLNFVSLSLNSQGRKINKMNLNWRKIKVSPFSDDMILYIENSKQATRKLLVLTNEFDKLVGQNTNPQEYLAFLYTNNEISERELKETISFNFMTKRRKKKKEIKLLKKAKSCTQTTIRY